MLQQKLDIIDQRLIYLLEKNARQAISVLAKSLKISKQVANYRLNRLEKNEYIFGYYPIIDTSKLGYTTYRIYLNFENANAVKRKEIIDSLKSINEIAHVYTFNNIWDIAISVVVKSIKEFHNIWNGIMKNKSYFCEYHVSVYSPIYHYTRTILDPDKKDLPELMILGDENEEKHDEKDIATLKSIATNVRKPVVQIAQEINENPQFVITRLRQMEKKGIIRGYRPIFNWEKLGYIYHKANITLSNYELYEKILKYCETVPNIFQVDKTIGGWDLEIELYVKNQDEFLKIINSFETKFPNAIKKYNYLTIDKIYKENYIPFD